MQDELEKQAQHDKVQCEYTAQLEELDHQIRQTREQMEDELLHEEHKIAVLQKQKNLEAAIAQAKKGKSETERSKKSNINEVQRSAVRAGGED